MSSSKIRPGTKRRSWTVRSTFSAGRSDPRKRSSNRQKCAETGEVGGGAVVGTGCTNEARICRHGQEWSRVGERRRSRRPGPCANEPNLPRRGRERHCHRWERSHQTKPIGSGVSGMKCQVNRVRRRVLQSPLLPPKTCETKPIPPEPRSNALWNKSYDELDAQQTSAKQSQFPPGPRWTTAGKVGACRRWEPDVRNKPNLPRNGPERRRRRRERSRQTKPIGRGVSSMKCQVNRVRRRVLGISHFQLPTWLSRRAKRSQLCRVRPSRWIWSPPPHAGRTSGRPRRRFFLASVTTNVHHTASWE